MGGPEIGRQTGSGPETLLGCLGLASSKLDPAKSVMGAGAIGMPLDHFAINFSALVPLARRPKQFAKS